MVIREPQRQHWFLALQIYLQHPEGVKDTEVATLLDITRARACELRHELTPYRVYRVSYARYSVRPTEPMITFAHIVMWRIGHEIGGSPHRARRTPRA